MAILKFLPHIILYKNIFYTFILMLTVHLYFLPCFLLKRVLHPMWPYGALFRTSKSQNMQTLGACRKEIPCKFGWWLFTALRYDHNLSHDTKRVCKGICLTPKIRFTSLYCFHLVLHSHAIVSSPFLVVFYENKKKLYFYCFRFLFGMWGRYAMSQPRNERYNALSSWFLLLEWNGQRWYSMPNR